MNAETGAALMLLLDTNVAGALLKEEPPGWLDLYRPLLTSRLLALSVQTEGELRRWALRNQWGAGRWANLKNLVSGLLVLPADRAVADAWARLMVHTEARGRALAPADAWVAATAVTNALPLVTHDKDLADLDFEGLDVICKA